ncbi:MAG: LytR C-terminal domain-containing protein [Actinomycetota bacterium]
MGKHSAPDSPGFWRAAAIAGFKYLAVAAVLAGLGFGAYSLLRADDSATPVADPVPTDDPFGGVSPDPDLELGTIPEPEVSPADGTTPPADPSPDPTPTSTPDSSISPSPAPLGSAVPGTGLVQILDGAGSGIKAAKAKQQIQASGYQTTGDGQVSRPYQVTTVFYQPGQQQLAEQVKTVVGASVVAPAPASLTDTTIPVTVVIGLDYAG